MNKLVLSLLFSCCYLIINAQSPTELYESRDYKTLIEKYAGKLNELNSDECYMVGYAYFQLEDDNNAIKCYDKSIAKGAIDGGVHFYKGLSLRYQKKYDEALKEIDLAIKIEPTNQEFMNEKGLVYYYQNKYDKALPIFEEAKKLPNTFPEPIYWIGKIYLVKEDYEKALSAFYEAVKVLPESNSNYTNAYFYIGRLEYKHNKDYSKSAAAYETVIKNAPSDYESYYKLMISYNAAKEYVKADSIFEVVKLAFEQKKLPKEDMEIKTVAIAQFEWNGQIATIRRSLVDPKEILDISYKVFLLDKENEKVVRRFVVEKTIQLEENGAKHLLCEQDKKSGDHITYPYGWSVDKIPVESLEKAVRLVLDGKMTMGASSNFGK